MTQFTSSQELLRALTANQLVISRRNHHTGDWIEVFRIQPDRDGLIVTQGNGRTGATVEIARITFDGFDTGEARCDPSTDGRPGLLP